jgi:serine/threonine protein kinase
MNQHRQEGEEFEEDEDLDEDQQEDMDDDDEEGAQPQEGASRRDAAAAAAAANVPQLEGYDRAELIGQGAYGMVFRGRRRETQEACAIKHIAFGENNMEGGVPCAVIREISLLRELDHPNVVRLIDVIQAQPGGLYLVFEFVDYDLKKYMDAQQVSDDPMQRRGLGPQAVKKFLRQILDGVRFCHTYRVLHRDLKPHNVRVHFLLLCLISPS